MVFILKITWAKNTVMVSRPFNRFNYMDWQMELNLYFKVARGEAITSAVFCSYFCSDENYINEYQVK